MSANKRPRYKRKDFFSDIALALGTLALVCTGVVFVWISTLEIPDLSTFEERRILQSTKIYDRTGEVLLYDLHQDVKRTIIPYEEISRHIKNATVAIEDDTFFEHWGVRPLAIVRAAISNLRGGDLFGGQGGSTITQQVIKNALLEPEKTLSRKMKEAILAIRLEQQLTKEEILAHYLNESPYGGTIYGVEEASQSFFGKSASEVTLAEAAYLAALPQAPTRYSPYGSERDGLLEDRKNHVLDRMLKNGFITEEEYNEAKDAEVTFLPQDTAGIKAPHFVMYVREILAEEFGEASLSERGFRVITSLNYDLQKEAERIVKEKAEYNETAFNARNAGLVAIDPNTGEILTMVGSRDYFDEEIDGNFNIALAERQPGSAFKPFVYAAAFARGYTPQTTLFDVPTQFSTACEPSNTTSEGDCYAPSNYDDEFRGPISMRNALAQSLNIPAVKTLYLAGIDNAIKLARDAGITTLTGGGRYGLTLVLGGGEVRLLEMVSAYGVFADEGVAHEVLPILSIENKDGDTVAEYEPRASQAIDRDVALSVTDVLADNVARTPLYGANSLLHFGDRDVAAKTGTTNDYRDAWIIGYTPNIVVGAWAGNNDNSSMAKKISGLIITPLWREYMDIALEEIEPASFPAPPAVPNDIKPVLRSNGVVLDSGALASEIEDGGTGTAALADIIYDRIHSILHFVVKENPRGPYPANPYSDGQYVLWEYGVTNWKNERFGALRAAEETDEETDAGDGVEFGSNEDEGGE